MVCGHEHFNPSFFHLSNDFLSSRTDVAGTGLGGNLPSSKEPIFSSPPHLALVLYKTLLWEDMEKACECGEGKEEGRRIRWEANARGCTFLAGMIPFISKTNGCCRPRETDLLICAVRSYLHWGQ